MTTEDSITQLTENLIEAHANLKNAESILEAAGDALTEVYRNVNSKPDQILVNTSKGWILLEFDCENLTFTTFRKFGNYGIVIP